MKVLLHAESFGFGPAALIRRLLPHIVRSDVTFGFLGIGHTSDLMADSGLAEMYSFWREPEDKVIAAILDRYDVVITAMDWKVAGIASTLGKRIVFIDALAWFWGEFPSTMQNIDLYIAQDFVGVQERLAKESTAKHSLIVPPMVNRIVVGDAKQRDLNLLNLGGLSNPLWTNQAPLAYARVIDRVIATLPGEWIKLTNQAIASGCRTSGFQTASPCEALSFLSRAETAVMTGGLGNILDAAATGTTPVLFLPAANDSQGRQLQLLKNEKSLDAWVDWQDIGFEPIDYYKPQPEVMATIERYLTCLSCSSVSQGRLDAAIKARKAELTHGKSILAHLLDRFGSDGLEATADAIHRLLN